MAKSIWGALKRLGRGTTEAKTGTPAARAIVKDDAKGSEKVKAVRMRTKAPRAKKKRTPKGRRQ